MKLRYTAVMAVALLASCGEKARTGGTGRGNGIATVDFIVVEPVAVDHSLGFAATLLANEAIEVRPEITGRLVSVGFDEGADVARGDVMFRIDDSELQAQLRKNQAELETARLEWERRKQLLEQQGISLEATQTAQTKYETLLATRDLLEAQAAKCVIAAPFNGKAGLRMVSPGAVVSSSTLMTTLTQTDPVKLEFAIPEQYLADLKTGAAVWFTTESNADRFDARVYAIDPRVDQQSRTVTVRAICPNPGNKLLPGGFAKANLAMLAGQKGIMIPAKAIVPVLNGQQVYTIQQGKAQPADVKTGRRTEEMVEILEGLNQGDTVVMSSLLQLRPGMAVKPRVKTTQPTSQP